MPKTSPSSSCQYCRKRATHVLLSIATWLAVTFCEDCAKMAFEEAGIDKPKK